MNDTSVPAEEAAVSRPGEGKSRRSRVVALLGVAGIVAVVVLAVAVPWPGDSGPPLPTIDATGATDEVVAAVEEAIEKVEVEPLSGARRGELAMVLRAHGFDRPADEVFRQAEQLDPGEFRWPYLLGVSLENVDREEAEDCLRRAMQLKPELALPRLPLAELIYEAGRFDEAVVLFEEALDLEPSNSRALLGLARVMLVKEEYERAETLCGKALRISWEDRMAHELKARLLFAQGRLDEAAGERELLAEMPQVETSDDPYVAEVLMLRQDPNWIAAKAQTMLAVGQTERAVKYLEQVIRDHPGRSEFPLELARALGGSGQAGQAVQVLERAIAQSPESSELRLLEGLVNRELGRAAAATASFEAAIERKPDHAHAWLWLGRTQLDRRRPKQAEYSFGQAIRYRPDLPDSHVALGELLLNQGRAAAAVPYLVTAVSLRPGDKPLRQQLIKARRAARAGPGGGSG